MMPVGGSMDSYHRTRSEGARINSKNKAAFFNAISERYATRVEGLRKQYSSRELRHYISEMEECGCHQEANLARKALEKKK